MSHVIPFKRRRTTNEALDQTLGFLRNLILDADTPKHRMELTMGGVRLTVESIQISYEEERLKFFAENKLMTASGLTTLMMLTPEIFREELFDAAAIDVQLWDTIPHVERFITARKGGFEYNFRTASHDIAQARFQVLAYEPISN